MMAMKSMIFLIFNFIAYAICSVVYIKRFANII